MALKETLSPTPRNDPRTFYIGPTTKTLLLNKFLSIMQFFSVLYIFIVIFNQFSTMYTQHPIPDIWLLIIVIKMTLEVFLCNLLAGITTKELTTTLRNLNQLKSQGVTSKKLLSAWSIEHFLLNTSIFRLFSLKPLYVSLLKNAWAEYKWTPFFINASPSSFSSLFSPSFTL